MKISYSKLFVGISLPALCTGLASLILSISATAQPIRPTTQKELKVFDPMGNTGNIGIRAAAGTVSYTLTLPNTAPSANQVLTANSVSGGNVTLTWGTPFSGTGTTNYVSKFATAGSLTNSQIFDNGTNVGIGTITPTARLEIRGAGTTSATTALEVDNSAGTPLLVVKNDGNVGIGTITPTGRLHLYKENDGAINMLTLGTAFDGGNTFAINPFITGVSNGGFSIRDVTKSVDRLVIENSTGNVGIGTTIPTLGKLQVSGSIAMTDDQNAYLYIPRHSPNDTRAYIVAGDSDRDYPVGMEFRVRAPSGQGTTIMNFDANSLKGQVPYSLNIATVSGNVGIGTTDPGGKLEVNEPADANIQASLIARGGNNRIAQFNFGVKNSSGVNVGGSIGSIGGNAGPGNGGLILQGNTDLITANDRHFFISAGGETRLRATSSTQDRGDYNLQVNGSGVWAAGPYMDGSDSTLKFNIKALSFSTEVLKKLRPVTYNYKPSYNMDTTLQAGFIAQEVQEALKGTDYVDGVVKKGSVLSMAYQSLIPLLTKALQESIDRIEFLEKKISILEQKVVKY